MTFTIKKETYTGARSCHVSVATSVVEKKSEKTIKNTINSQSIERRRQGKRAYH